MMIILRKKALKSLLNAQKKVEQQFLLYQTYAFNMVTQTGFEPTNNALRGHRVKPLLHWASDKVLNHNYLFISTGFYRFLHHSQDCYLLF